MSHSSSTPSTSPPTTTHATDAPPVWNRDTPYLATLSHQHRLTAAGSPKDVRHVEIDLGNSGLRYQPGDTLAIWVKNDPSLVEEICKLCRLLATELVNVEARTLTLAEALLSCFELTRIFPGFIKHYAQLCPDPELAVISNDVNNLRSYLPHRQIVDVLEQFPAELSAEQLLSCLRRLNPRQYSIASSQKIHPNLVALTVNIVRYETDAHERKGAGSAYLGWRVQPGESLPVFVVPNDHFKLPEDTTKPVIMIGPGTGIAPFRAFLQERDASGSTGLNWLFFGNPTRKMDFLYEQECLNYQRSGLLTRLDLAFSRDQASKIYVQHRMLEQAATLFEWIQQGAHIYVCGDAKHMAEDVQKVLLQIIEQQGKMDIHNARQYLVKMRQEKKYVRDVY